MSVKLDTLRGVDEEYGIFRLWLPVVALIGVLVVSSHFSGPPAGPSIQNFDKIAHFCVFGLLGTLFFRPLRIEFLDWRRWAIAFCGVFAYSVTDEVLQFFNPDRSFDPMDWLADWSGTALAIYLYRNVGWYRKLLEWRLWGRLAK